MTDEAEKHEKSNDAVPGRTEKAAENLAKSTPEVNADNLRSALKANPKKSWTVSPEGSDKEGFTLVDKGGIVLAS